MRAEPAGRSVLAARVDRGRLVAVPLFALLLLVNLGALVTQARTRHGAAAVVAVLASTLTITFYLLVIGAYLRRGEASATTASLPARAAAVVATGLPMLLPFAAAGREVSLGSDLAASALMVVGLGWSLWSLHALGTNLSVVAQARGLAAAGPYRRLRHPLYVGEIVTLLGIVVRSPGPAVIALWVVLVLLQAYRAVVEERLLAAAQPGYADYRCRTARFLPGVF